MVSSYGRLKFDHILAYHPTCVPVGLVWQAGGGLGGMQGGVRRQVAALEGCRGGVVIPDHNPPFLTGLRYMLPRRIELVKS